MAHKPSGATSAEVYSITAARRSHGADMSSRMIRYSISMGVRMICFVLALVVPGPARWFFIVGAILLPYVAVIIANAGREKMGPNSRQADAGFTAYTAGDEPVPEVPRAAIDPVTVIVHEPPVRHSA